MPRFISHLLAPALALALVSPACASAQFGGLIKKAKKVTHTEAAAAPVAGGPQLTEQSVQGLLRALPVIQGMTQTRSSLVTRQQAASREYSSLTEQHDAENAAYNKSTQDVGSCRDDAFSKINDAHQKAMEAKQANLMSDPAAMQQYMELARQTAALQAKGDTKGAIELGQQFQAKMLGVSAGYVNLLENNERSLSLRVLMALADHYGVDWRTVVGVAAAVVALLLRRGFLVVFLVGVGVTALLRLVT